MKLGTLVNSVEGLKAILGLKLDASKAFELALFAKNAEKEINIFHELRSKKIQEMGKEQDGLTTVMEENVQSFMEYMKKLSEKEIEIEVPKLAKEDLKGDIDANTLLSVSYIFE